MGATKVTGGNQAKDGGRMTRLSSNQITAAVSDVAIGGVALHVLLNGRGPLPDVSEGCCYINGPEWPRWERLGSEGSCVTP